MSAHDFRVSIVIITWNSFEVLDACIDSIVKWIPEDQREIIVVDNNSGDKSYLEQHRGTAGVRLVLNPENAGYARAANLGFRQASGTHYLILNPDITFVSNPFPKLVGILEGPSGIGVIGPLLYSPSGTPQVEGYYPNFPTPMQFVFLNTWVANLSLSRKIALRFFHPEISLRGVQRIDQIPGAFLLFRKGLFSGEPPMNEAYFLWLEDVDFCRRVRNAGLDVAVDADEKALHLGASSFNRRTSQWKREVYTRSYLTYVDLYAPTSTAIVYRFLMGMDAVCRILLAMLRSPKYPRRFILDMASESRILGRVFRKTEPSRGH